MTLAEIAARAEQATDALTAALHDQPVTEETVDRLRGIVQSAALALCEVATDPDLTGPADSILNQLAGCDFDALAEAVKEAAYRRSVAA